MARVSLTGDLARRFVGGDVELSIEAANIRRLFAALEDQYPGMGEVLNDGSLAVAIDGIIIQDAFLEPLEPDSEVVFLPAIRGG